MAPRGKHAPPGDRSFAVSLISHLAAGIALVAAVAAAFWGLGQVQAPGDPVIQDPVAAPTPDTSEEETETSDPTPEPEETETEPTPEPVEDDADEAEESEETDEPDEPDRAVDPSTISLQILDAAGDGGTRAAHAGEVLRADGYRVVAEGRAVRGYERTTVFYSQGHEDAARQIAEDHGYAVVEPNQGNLSASVNVHVVVGEDHPAG